MVTGRVLRANEWEHVGQADEDYVGPWLMEAIDPVGTSETSGGETNHAGGRIGKGIAKNGPR